VKTLEGVRAAASRAVNGSPGPKAGVVQRGARMPVNAGSILTPLFRPNFDPLWLC